MRPISPQPSLSLPNPKDHLHFTTLSQPQQDNTSGVEICTFRRELMPRESNYQWSDEQNRIYYEFLLRCNQSHLQLNSSGKVKKINVQMSRYIQTRTSAQCRSHHQKMMKRFGQLDALIDYFQAYFCRKGGHLLCRKAACNIALDQNAQKMSIMRQNQAQQSTLPWPVTPWDLRYSPALIIADDQPQGHKE